MRTFTPALNLRQFSASGGTFVEEKKKGFPIVNNIERTSTPCDVILIAFKLDLSPDRAWKLEEEKFDVTAHYDIRF
jgi:hypothetical protein